MEIVIKIIQFILSFSLLIFVHEMGHFVFAKLFKIRVEKFYLFFNPGFSLFKFTWRGTEYGMGWIPFGGYVSIAGMIDESKNSSSLASEPQPYEFRSKPAWQRLLVMTGGVLMNIITAIVIFIFMSYSQGTKYIKSDDVVDGYVFTETAKELGFMDGDKILSVDGKAQDNYVRYREAIVINDSPVVLVDRAGLQVEIQIEDEDIPKLLKDQIIFNLRSPFEIDSLSANGALSKAGFTKNDSIISINDERIKYFDEIRRIGADNKSKIVKIATMRSDGSIDTLNVQLGESGIFGFVPYFASISSYYKITEQSYTFLQSIPRGFQMTWDMCKSYVKQLKMIFRPETEAYKSVGSVLSIGNLFPPVWDWVYFWNITAMISVILAVMNMLPIPALDGGHVLFLLVEVITRKKPSDSFLEKMQIIGFWLLMGIMVLAMWNDIVKFFF